MSIKHRCIATLVTVATLLAIPTSVGCGPGATVIDTVKEGVIECVKQNLGQTVTEVGVSLLLAVVSIISAGADGWRDALNALGVKYGEEAVACAAAMAADLFATPPVPMPAGTMRVESPSDRAHSYMKGWRFR